MQISPALSKRYQFFCFAGVALALSLIALLGGLVFTLIGFSNLQSWWDIAVSVSTQNLLFSATIQAFWSTILSLILGTLVARALLRRNWIPFSSLLATLSFVAMIMPTTVAALALLAVWGRNGVLRDVLESFNLEGMLFPAYGLEMVVLAHVFFNAPLVLRVMLGALYAVPETQNRLAAQLRFNAFSYWKWIEWPAIKVHIPSLFGLIFLLCFSSFSLVLMLGGGPKVSTLEVAIYTSLRFSFDLPTAGVLACLQLGISTAIILLLSRFKSVHWAVSLHSNNTAPRPDKSAFLSVLSDVLMIGLFCFLIVYPLINLVVHIDFHAGGSLFYRPQFWQALQGSLLLGLLSSIISVSIVCVLSNAYYRIGFFSRIIGGVLSRRMILLSVSIYLVVPSIVLGTASFIWLRSFVDLFSVAFWLVLAANCLLSLPFAWRILGAPLQAVLAATDKQCQMLNLHGWQRFFTITLPALRHELGLALGLTAALSIGDLGVIALFGSDTFRTLPWLLYQYASRYGGAEADLLGCLLLFICLGFYGIFYLIITVLARRRSYARRNTA